MNNKTMTMLALLGFGFTLSPLASVARADDRQQAPSPSQPSQGGSNQGGGRMQNSPSQGSTAEHPAVVEEELVTAPFTVEAIDRKNRKLTVRSPDGESTTITVPPETKGFDNLKKGDKIDVDFYRSVAIAVLPAGATPTRTQQEQSQARAQGGTHGRQITSSGKVTSVNTQDNTVQVRGPDGKNQKISVEDPALRRQLQDVKPGDVVQITYTEAVAAEIRPSGKSAK
jgi:hypothetical protein